MSTSNQPPSTVPVSLFRRFVFPALSRSSTYVALGLSILFLDLITGPYLQFPILFVIPVALSAWFCSSRLAFALAILLPVGRLFIAVYEGTSGPLVIIVANCLIRITVLFLITYFVRRTAQLTRELEQRINTLVTICAWSRTVEYQGAWISFEEYLRRRFNIDTTHGISPAEARKVLSHLHEDVRNA